MTPNTSDQQQFHARNVRLQQENERLKQEIAQCIQTNEALKASNDRYQALVEAQTEFMCCFAPDGTLTFVNQTYCDKFGEASETLLGTSFFASILPEDREIAKMHLASLSQDRPTGTFEYRVILPHGEVHWYQWTNHLFCDQQGQAHEFQAVGHDITGYKNVEDILDRYHEQVYDLVIERTRDLSQSNERLQQEIVEHGRVERALTKSEAQYRMLYEEAPNGYFSIGPDGMIKHCNQAASDLLGYSCEELLEMSVFNLYADLPDGLPKARTIFQRFLAGEEIHDEELQMQRKDGTPVWISLTVSPVCDQRGQVIESRAMMLNITRRKLAEQFLRLSEQQYRLLAEHVADGIAIYQEGSFVFVNQALSSLFKYSKEHFLRIKPIELLRDDYQKPGRERSELAQKWTSDSAWQAPCLTGDGREIWVEAHRNAIEWQGKPAFLMTVRDISSHKRRELSIQKERNHLRRQNIALRTTLRDRYKFGPLIGKSPLMQAVYESMMTTSASDANVIICGESGTGKELVARTIHQRSARQKEAFVAVNCGAVPETLFEREFFGHRKGAFTGADQDKPGFFDQARNGTLFLDEVGELSPPCQVKLLRAIEEKAFIPIGQTIRKKVDVRIIAATNSNLLELLATGEIRKDFFYRIRVIEINLPPLRDRREDIPLLVDHLLKQYSKGEVDCAMLPGHIIEALCTYDWPGNVRELQNELQRYLNNQPLQFIGNIQVMSATQDHVLRAEDDVANLPLQKTLEACEKRIIAAALARNHWKTKATADLLGITQRSLQRKIKKYHLM